MVGGPFIAGQRELSADLQASTHTRGRMPRSSVATVDQLVGTAESEGATGDPSDHTTGADL